MTRLAAVLVVLALARAAAADPDADAARTFHDALAAGDVIALEQLAEARPATRWTDDAWLEAARIAVKSGDLVRGRRDLEQAIAVGTDDQLVRRARAELARVIALAGEGGEWTQVAAEHDRLAAAVHAPGDPRPALAELERLVEAHPRYPRLAQAMATIAAGWERDGERPRAIAWLRRASEAAGSVVDRVHAEAELVRALIRDGALEAARSELPQTRANPALETELAGEITRAEHRRWLRWILWAVLAAIAAAAVVALRRAGGSWRAVARRLARPPAELLFFAPIALVLVIIAHTGNPLVARAVTAIAIAGGIVAWVSGAILEGRSGALRLGRVVAHAVLAVVAVVSATYLAVDHERMIDLVIETWNSGPETR